MSETKVGMNLTEKTTVGLGIFGALIAFSVLILGENVLRLAYKPDIYLSTDSVSLEGLGSSKEHVRLFDFYNSGTGASTNIKIVAKFSTPDVKFKIESDEEVKGSSLKNSLIEISLDRFSPRSHVKISVVSKIANALIDIYYIDDKGKSKIDPDRRSDSQDQWIKIVAILAVFFFIFFVILIFVRRLEKRIFIGWDVTSLELNDKISELKADIAELRVAPEEGKRNCERDETENNQEVEQRLQSLLRPSVPAR